MRVWGILGGALGSMFKKNTIAFVIVIVLTFTLGQVAKSNFVDCGILKVNTIDEFNKKDFRFDGMFYEEDTSNFIKYKNKYIDRQGAGADIIAIVRPTGNIEQFYWLIRQEVVIEKIVKGDKKLEGITTKLQNVGGYSYYNKDDTGYDLYYGGMRNLMQPDNKYLAFFNRIPLEEYIEKDSLFDLSGSFFSYLNITKIENSNIIRNKSDRFKLEELSEYEFFCTSKGILDIVYEIKKEIIKKYLGGQ